MHCTSRLLSQMLVGGGEGNQPGRVKSVSSCCVGDENVEVDTGLNQNAEKETARKKIQVNEHAQASCLGVAMKAELTGGPGYPRRPTSPRSTRAGWWLQGRRDPEKLRYEPCDPERWLAWTLCRLSR